MFGPSNSTNITQTNQATFNVVTPSSNPIRAGQAPIPTAQIGKKAHVPTPKVPQKSTAEGLSSYSDKKRTFTEFFTDLIFGPQSKISEDPIYKMQIKHYEQLDTAQNQLENNFKKNFCPLFFELLKAEEKDIDKIKQLAGLVKKYLKSISYKDQEEAEEKVDKVIQKCCQQMNRLDAELQYGKFRSQLLAEVFEEKLPEIAKGKTKALESTSPKRNSKARKRETGINSAGPSIPINANNATSPLIVGAENGLAVACNSEEISGFRFMMCSSATSQGFINSRVAVGSYTDSFTSLLDCTSNNVCISAIAASSQNTANFGLSGTFFWPGNESSNPLAYKAWSTVNVASSRIENIFGKVMDQYGFCMWDVVSLKVIRTASIFFDGTYTIHTPLVNGTNPKYTLIDTSSMIRAYKDWNNLMAIQKMHYDSSGLTPLSNAFSIAGSTDPFFLFKLDNNRLAVAFSKTSGGSSFAVFSLANLQQILEIHDYPDFTLKSSHCKGQLCIMLGRGNSNTLKLQPFYVFNSVNAGTQIEITGSESYTDSDIAIYQQEGITYNIGVFSTTPTGASLDRFTGVVEGSSAPVTNPSNPEFSSSSDTRVGICSRILGGIMAWSLRYLLSKR